MTFVACFGIRGTYVLMDPTRVLLVFTALLLSFSAGAFASESSHDHSSKIRINRPAQIRRAKHRIKNRRPNRFGLPEYSADQGEDVEGRQNWFMFQRTYPFNSVPVDGRRRAWEARPGKGKGVGRSAGEAAVWSPIGPMPTRSYAPLFSNFGLNSGRINAIAVSPADAQLVLVGAPTGGLWRSMDGGTSFNPVSDSQVDLAVGSIAFSISNPNIVYAGMGDMHGCCDYMGSGVLKSTDAGLSWTRVNNSTLPQPGTTGKIEVDPTNPNRVYLALYRFLDQTAENSFPYGGVYVSSDGGVNWTRTLAGLPRDFAINPSNPQMVYAAMRGIGTIGTGPAGGLYRSLNGGLNWDFVYDSTFGDAFSTLGFRDIRVAVSPDDPQRVYVYSGGGVTNGFEIRLAVSTDAGATFSPDRVLNASVDKGQFGYNTYLVADPFNANTIYIGARDVFKSINGGVSWTNITGNFDSSFSFVPFLAQAHPDQHAMAFSPAGANQFFIGNDGGLYKTVDGGATFQALNNTLSLTQFISLARHPADPSITYGGTQDNGTQRRQSGSSQWEDFSSGDAGHVVINPQDPTTLFVTNIGGTVWRFGNNGGSPRTVVSTDNTFRDANGAIERTAFYAPLTGNGVTSQIYFGTQRVWTSTNLGVTWTPMGTTPDLTKGMSDVLTTIAVSKSNSNVIYTGSEQGRVMISTDGGVTWNDAGTRLPNRFIASINVDYNNPAVAYLTVSGFGSGHVFKTTNTGATWNDVSGIAGQGGLPNIPTSALLIDPNNSNVIYAGTDVGVFRSTTGGTNWITFNDGMPPVIVTAFAMNGAGQIQVGTYGRGAYEATGAAGTFSISGRVTDGFGNGIGGATVTLTGTAAASTTADSNGSYTLANLPAGGAYVLSPTKAGQFIPFARSVTNLGSDTVGFDLRLDPFVNASIHVNDSSGGNLAVVSMSINGLPGGTTNASGSLSLNVSVPAVGNMQTILAPIKLGYAFNPASFSFSSQSGNQVVLFSAIPPNPMDDARGLVAQTYRDFLAREADPGGLDYWSSQINGCGVDALCFHNKRIDVSAAFFVEAEFQRTGSFVYRLYKGGLGRRPVFTEFVTDRAQVVEGPTLEQTKQALALAFVQRPEFVGKYASATTAETFVDASITNTNVAFTPQQRQALIDKYNSGGNMAQSRALATRDAIDASAFQNAEYNPSFVLMQYFGYLRRDPEQEGYLFWLDVLNNRVPGNFRSMVCAFVTSSEYQRRFGNSVTRSNRDCGQ